jgi:two-component system, NarL family, nitrate/nitrite response regulator NarL
MEITPKKPAKIRSNGKNASQAYIAELLLELLKHAPPDPRPAQLPTNSDDGQEVMLTQTIDGVSYTLLRSCPPTRASTRAHLSPRELEVVRLVAKGYPNKAIAAVLEISPWTVATHLRRIYGKLDVSTRTEMVALILHSGYTK